MSEYTDTETCVCPKCHKVSMSRITLANFPGLIEFGVITDLCDGCQ